MNEAVHSKRTSRSLRLETRDRCSFHRISATQSRLGSFLILLFILLVDKSVCSQQSVVQEQVVRDPQAISLLKHAWTLMGGAAWSSAGAVRLSGTLDIYQAKQQNGEFALSAALSGDTTLVVSDAEGKRSSYSRNGSLMSSTRAGESSKTQSLHTALSVPPYFPLELIHRVLNDPSWSISLIGVSTVNSASCTEVEIKRVYPLSTDRYQTISKFTDRHLYIETQSGLVNRISLTAYSPTNINITMPRILNYADYRQIGSYVLPSSISDTLNGQTYLHMTVTSANSQ